MFNATVNYRHAHDKPDMYGQQHLASDTVLSSGCGLYSPLLWWPLLSGSGGGGEMSSGGMLPERRRQQQPDSGEQKKLFRPWQDDEGVTNGQAEPGGRMEQLMKLGAVAACCAAAAAAAASPVDKDDVSKSTMELVATSLGKTVDGHRCIYCGKLYSRKYGLKIHLRTHTGFKPLRCKVCQRPFGDPSNLNKHSRLHSIQLSGQSTLRCPYCGKCLVRKRDLDRHVASRHGAECAKGSGPRQRDAGFT